MKYKHVLTGAVIEARAGLRGEFWQLIEEPKPTATETPKPATKRKATPKKKSNEVR